MLFPVTRGRGDLVRNVRSGPNPRPLPPKSLRALDIYTSDLHLDNIKARTRNFHGSAAARAKHMANAVEVESAILPATRSPPLSTQPVSIDADCVGDRWTAHDGTSLAKLIAIIAMGQAAYAAYILKELLPAAPAFSDADLRQEARVRMTARDDAKKAPRTGYPRWQRDGFIFEAISWIAARQVYGKDVLLKDPHVSATSQGLDGLMIELADDRSEVVMTTIFEDKCTDDPRGTFLQKVIPAFLDRHNNKRSAELVATASALLRMSGIDERAAAKLAANVMDRTQRRYRAAFALTKDQDSEAERQKLFKGYGALDGLTQDQRVGAILIVDGNIRDWFENLAVQAIAYLDELVDNA
jgi:hypothetical protein